MFYKKKTKEKDRNEEKKSMDSRPSVDTTRPPIIVNPHMNHEEEKKKAKEASYEKLMAKLLVG